MGWEIIAADASELTVEVMADAEIRGTFSSSFEDDGDEPRLVLSGQGVVLVLQGSPDEWRALARRMRRMADV